MVGLHELLRRKKDQQFSSTFPSLPVAPPLSAADLSYESPKKPPNLSRRRFLFGSAAVAGGVAISGNKIVTEILWPPSAASVREIKADVPEDKRHAATFVFGGLGTRDSTKEALAIKGAVQDIGRVVSVRYNEDKLDLNTVAERMNQYIKTNGITEINIYGDSMGGIAGVHTLPKLDFSLNGGVRVKYIFADCTPITKANVRDHNATFPEFLAKHGFEGGGFVGKLSGQIYSNFNHPQDYLKIKQQLETAWHVTLDPNSPSLWIDQLKLISESNIDTFAQCLAAVNYEEMYYIHPKNPSDDAVVYDISALKDLVQANYQAQSYRRRHGKVISQAHVTPISIPGISHASCVENPDRYVVALRGKLLSAAA